MASPKPDKPIKVFLIDDHPIVCDGVRAYLTSHSVKVVGVAFNAREALRRVKKAKPDIVILDNLNGGESGKLALRLRRLIPNTKLISFSIHSSEAYVLRMARCGVQAYVTKDQPAHVLLGAIRYVFRFKRPCEGCFYWKRTSRLSSTCSRAACIFDRRRPDRRSAGSPAKAPSPDRRKIASRRRDL